METILVVFEICSFPSRCRLIKRTPVGRHPDGTKGLPLRSSCFSSLVARWHDRSSCLITPKMLQLSWIFNHKQSEHRSDHRLHRTQGSLCSSCSTSSRMHCTMTSCRDMLLIEGNKIPNLITVWSKFARSCDAMHFKSKFA